MVAVIGAGAVGLTLAGRLAQYGVPVELFEAEPAMRRIGSRAICMQRETLETWARLGIGEQVAERGVRWRVGRTYYRGRQLFETRLPEGDEHFPPFVNISQTEVEERLEERLRELGVTVRRGQRLTGLHQAADAVTATLETAQGPVEHRSAFLVGTDGAHSTVRHEAGIAFDGYTLDDRFLIADVRARLSFSNERHFHFDPLWNPGRQVLIHPQPHGVWRIDWQVSPQTDVDAELGGGGLHRRIAEVVGEGTRYELVWATAYRFSQRLASSFRDSRVLLAGDAAHVMSPFGARGLNSGVADAENLAWKLAWVLRHGAPDQLLDTYAVERRGAAVENLAATDATMRFMAPHGPLWRTWRELVMRMAPRSAWFRRRVNSGRLAEPSVYRPSVVIAPDPGVSGGPRHGRVAPDAALPDGERLRDRLGRGYAVVAAEPIEVAGVDVITLDRSAVYPAGRAWLIRPDGYVADSRPIERAAELAP